MKSELLTVLDCFSSKELSKFLKPYEGDNVGRSDPVKLSVLSFAALYLRGVVNIEDHFFKFIDHLKLEWYELSPVVMAPLFQAGALDLLQALNSYNLVIEIPQLKNYLDEYLSDLLSPIRDSNSSIKNLDFKEGDTIELTVGGRPEYFKVSDAEIYQKSGKKDIYFAFFNLFHHKEVK